MTDDRRPEGGTGREEIIARNRRLDEALGTPTRGIWLATGAVLLLGLVAVVWFTSPGEHRRRQVMEELQLGDTVSRAVAHLGEAGARCPGSSLAHLRSMFPPGWPAASVETALQALGRRTRERWVYPLNPRRVAGCDPRDGQTEIGVGPDGRIVWYVAVTGKTPLRLPEEITPAGSDAPPRER